MNTLILTLDFINDICHPKGKVSRFADRIASNKVINKANQVIHWARNHNHLIAHVRVGFRENYQDCPVTSPVFGAAKLHQALQLNTWGTEFCEELDVNESDIIITKHRVSAFYATDLETILRANQIQHLILVGVATNNAVELTAREAHDRDYLVTVIADACETVNNEEQQASLSFLARIATVTTAQAIIA